MFNFYELILERNIKEISFPEEEHEQLSKQDVLYTTRVSSDYSKYKKGDIVHAPWNKHYKIIDKKKFKNIKEHPFYNELTNDQKKLIGKYSRISVLKLQKHNEDENGT